jgi:DNA-binding SARP family transcriptional activator
LEPLRVYLTGRISIEQGSELITERDLAGRQGRLAFTFLATEHHHAVSRDQLVCAVWGDDPPRETDAALNAIVSKLRTSFKRAGPGTSSGLLGIEARSSAVQMILPPETWIDTEAAANATDKAEGALRTGRPLSAWGDANVGVSITRRPFLVDEEAPWIEAKRTKLRSLLARSLQALSQVSSSQGDPELALQYAAEIIEVEPFRETGYRNLMRLHSQMGNRAEALRVFGKCRALLREELGADPSQETQALFLEILRQA